MAADVRTWCTRCGVHVAYEYRALDADRALCPVCRDDTPEQSNLIRGTD